MVTTAEDIAPTTSGRGHVASARRGAEPVAVAIDLGTGGPKVGLVTYTGELLWHAVAPVDTRLTPDGGAVQDADEWWRIIGDLIGRGLAAEVVAPERIAAVSITGQYASTVPVDAAGGPVGEALLWRDTRGGRHARRRFGGHAAGYDIRSVATWIRRTAGAPALSGADPIGHRLFLQAERPAVTAAARWMLEPIDQLAMRFTGVANASPASMAAAWLVDVREPGRFFYDSGLIDRSGVERRHLPPLGPSNRFVGAVLPSVAERLGLPGGVRVTAPLPDLHTAALGSGAVSEGRAHLALSTSSWISAPVTAKKTDITRQIATVPGLRGDDYLIIDNHEVGASALEWFRSVVSVRGGEPPGYDELTALAATAPPGSGDVLFTPWLAGERSPVADPHARGGFHNLSVTTGPRELVRAVLEGVAYNSRWLHEAVEKFASARFDPVRIIGGGAQSDLWCQIHADVLGRTIERPADPMLVNLRGAGLAAGVAAGSFGVDDVTTLVPVDRTFTPDAERRGIYDRLFGEFPGRYRAGKRMFARLARSAPVQG